MKKKSTRARLKTAFLEVDNAVVRRRIGVARTTDERLRLEKAVAARKEPPALPRRLGFA